MHTQARVPSNRKLLSLERLSYLFKLKNDKIELPVVAVWINDVLLTKMQLVKFVKTKSCFR
jgi:hypothetical protein